MIAGYTSSEGQKVSVVAPGLVPHVIIYDATFALETPFKLFTSTGIRALDHAVELLYHPDASEVPTKALALSAILTLFTYLPRYEDDPNDQDVITRLQLASFASLSGMGTSLKGGLGLSHSMGYAMGSPYGIPHGITSCISLPGVVRLKAEEEENARQLARALPMASGKRAEGGNGPDDDDAKADALKVADRIEDLVKELGLETRLSEYKVGKDQVDVIARNATGKKEGEVFEGVKRIVEGKL